MSNLQDLLNVQSKAPLAPIEKKGFVNSAGYNEGSNIEIRNQRQVTVANDIQKQLLEVAEEEMIGTFANLFKRQSNLGKLRQEDVKLALVSFALRMNVDEVTLAVNRQRRVDGITDDISGGGLKYYREKYRDIIDEIYTVGVMRIGEVYSLADKVVRIARYNEIGTLLYDNFIPELRKGVVMDSTSKKINAFMKVMEKLNIEMGSKSLDESIKRPKSEEEDTLSPQDIKDALKAKMDEKYKAQLPELVKHAEEVQVSDAPIA